VFEENMLVGIVVGVDIGTDVGRAVGETTTTVSDATELTVLQLEKDKRARPINNVRIFEDDMMFPLVCNGIFFQKKIDIRFCHPTVCVSRGGC
jgi:hypothetical protein